MKIEDVAGLFSSSRVFFSRIFPHEIASSHILDLGAVSDLLRVVHCSGFVGESEV